MSATPAALPAATPSQQAADLAQERPRTELSVSKAPGESILLRAVSAVLLSSKRDSFLYAL